MDGYFLQYLWVRSYTVKLLHLLERFLAVITSFPPLVGFSTTVSICGFAYGVHGFLLAGPAAVIGSAIVFVVLRFFFLGRVQQLTNKNEKWRAFESVIVSVVIFPKALLIKMQIPSEKQRAAIDNSHSSFSLTSLGVCQYSAGGSYSKYILLSPKRGTQPLL